MTRLLLVLLLVAAVTSDAQREGDGAQRVEDVEFGGRWYQLWKLPLPWDSASVVCENRGMRLAGVDDQELLDWAAEKTSGSAWATWLGARRGGPEAEAASGQVWRWTSTTQDKLSAPPNQWVDAAPGDHCLALASTPPHLAAFADLPCATPLPFLCERADSCSANLVQSVQLPERTVTFVESLSTYDEAERACRAFNGHLLTANTPQLQKALADVITKLHGAWVGARKDAKGIPRWSATGQAVPLLGERSLLLFEEDSELVVTHDEVTLKKSKRETSPSPARAASCDQDKASDGCVYVDRKGQLREIDCNTRRSYICETRSKSYFPITTEMIVNEKRIKVSTHPYVWESARKACGAFKARLANLRDMIEINGLARMPQEFQDLWLDGRLTPEGRWVDSDGGEIPKDKDANGYPPWASTDSFDDGGADADVCLGMYRQSLTEVLFVARPCLEEHGFVCVRDQKP